MGFFDNQKKKLEDKIQKELDSFLIENESVNAVYAYGIDFCAITNKRVIYVDKQWSSSKQGVISIPFSKITAISLTKGGFMSFSKEVELTIGSKIIELKFISDTDAMAFCKAVYNSIL